MALGEPCGVGGSDGALLDPAVAAGRPFTTRTIGRQHGIGEEQDVLLQALRRFGFVAATSPKPDPPGQAKMTVSSIAVSSWQPLLPARQTAGREFGCSGMVGPQARTNVRPRSALATGVPHQRNAREDRSQPGLGRPYTRREDRSALQSARRPGGRRSCRQGYGPALRLSPIQEASDKKTAPRFFVKNTSKSRRPLKDF
jgi:hypothetical protein